MLGAILGGAQAAMGAAQFIDGKIKAHRNEKDLENLKTPTETANAAVNDLYQSASANPFDSAYYKTQQQNIGRGMVGGINALHGRGMAMAGIASLVRGQDDSLMKAGAQAENMQNSRLQAATAMKSADDRRLFDINKMLPYQKAFSLTAAKASAGASEANAGIHNFMGGASTMGMGMLGKKDQSQGGGYNPYLGGV